MRSGQALLHHLERLDQLRTDKLAGAGDRDLVDPQLLGLQVGAVELPGVLEERLVAADAHRPDDGRNGVDRLAAADGLGPGDLYGGTAIASVDKSQHLASLASCAERQAT